MATIHPSVTWKVSCTLPKVTSHQSIINFLLMNTRAWRINEVRLLVHCDVPTDVPQSFCTFKLQSFDKTGHDQTKGVVVRENTRALKRLGQTLFCLSSNNSFISLFPLLWWNGKVGGREGVGREASKAYMSGWMSFRPPSLHLTLAASQAIGQGVNGETRDATSLVLPPARQVCSFHDWVRCFCRYVVRILSTLRQL